MFPMIEIIGYLASGLVVLSLAMTSVVRLRIISFIGSVTFVVYGLLIGSIPVLITNAAIALLNIWFLNKEFRKQNLQLVPIETDAPYLGDFLAAHGPDIKRLQPGFELREDAKVWLLNRDGLPAGAFVGRLDGTALHIDLDYVTPAYRDSRMGRYLYGAGARAFRDLGAQTLVADPGSTEHQRYLEAMGFIRTDDQMIRSL